MKTILFIALILCGVLVAYSQQDCCDKVAKQAVEIDSLGKILRSKNDSIRVYSHTIEETGKTLNDTIKQLRADLSKLKKFTKEKEAFDAQLKQLNDSITLLKNQIALKDSQFVIKESQITQTKQLADQKAIQEKENGKREALANILNTYKGKKFDDLIKMSSKESVQRDRQLVGNTEVKQTLDDLEKYFNAQELFSKRFEINSVKNAQNQINQINQQSELVTNLKDKLENFKIFNDGLKEMIEKINNLDKKESVKGMGEQIEKQKYNKILSELTSYIFSYDFNFTDYPYLSGIYIEIIKRKQPNADADISDLLYKL